jgi:7-cyano-7-deazaguanine synthase in queuosine biosynthesis
MKELSITLDERRLIMKGPKGLESLVLSKDYNLTPLSRFLFSQLGTMFLVSPYVLPQIQTNFHICPEIRALFAGMYESLQKEPPQFFSLDDQPWTLQNFCKFPIERAAVAHGGGKDSLRNMWWAEEEYGRENVLAVHVSGLNRAVAKREHEYCDRQQRELSFPNFKFIELRNGSRSNGHEIMRARDFFLLGLIIPEALEFGASTVITEGYAETKEYEPFSGKVENMRFFNQMLTRLNIPCQVTWRDREEVYAVKDLLIHRSGWLDHVSNCFTPAKYFANLRRCWERNAPSLRLYDSQCGSCPKCRTVNLARIMYDKRTTDHLALADAQYFLTNTKSWMSRNRVKFADFIDGSFGEEFLKACRLYRLAPRKK